MAPTLETIAEDGPRALYDGDLAAALADDVALKGGSLRLADLQAYDAVWQEPLSFAYRAARLHVTPQLTAGPTLAEAFSKLEQDHAPAAAPDGRSFAACAGALKAAYARRLAEGRRQRGASGAGLHDALLGR